MTIGKTTFPNGGPNDKATLNRFYSFPFTTGDVFFVHASGVAGGPGWAVENAFTTVDAAVGAAQADHGDLIVVCEGHTETVTAAAGIALDVAGVKVLGLGEGRRRPRITFGTATAASLDISAARCVLENVVLINAIDGQTAMVNVSAADVVVKGCEFQLGDASTQAAVGVLTTAAASRLIVQGNHMHGTVDAGVSNCIRLVGGDAIIVRENVLCAACATTGNIQSATTDCTNLQIIENFILNQTADGNNKAINLTAGSTGLIANNRIAIIDSTSPAPLTAAGAFVSGNYTVGAVGVGAASVLL